MKSKSRAVWAIMLALVAGSALATSPSTSGAEGEEQDLAGSVRITAPGGLILHKAIPAGTSFDSLFTFQVNAPGKGLNNRDLFIKGEVAMGPEGFPVFRGRCEETWVRLQGKIAVQDRRQAPFGGSLEHGRHTAVACQGVLVQVTLP